MRRDVKARTEFFLARDERISAAHRHVVDMWPALTRHDGPEEERIPLPHPYIMPNDETFPYLFYWDSYFTIVGLAVDGEWGLVRGMVENFLHELREFGLVLNFSHPSAITRSQPPYLTSMIKEVLKRDLDLAWLRSAFALAKREYEDIWLGRHDTSLGLCRYADLAYPDDEKRAQWESGWDYSSRWGGRCRYLAAVDLNCNLYLYERDFADFARLLGEPEEADRWLNKAEERRRRIVHHLYDSRRGLFFDYDVGEGRLMRERPSLATFHPLFVGLATPEEAAAVAANLRLFEHPGGLTCTVENYPVPEGTPQKPEFRGPFQWDYPNGWAPLHWVATCGLKRYGFFDEAARVALKWLSLCADLFAQTGQMWEKYNVVKRNLDVPTVYPNQKGFGWTNGVYSALLGKLFAGLDYDPSGRKTVLEPLFSSSLAGRDFVARFRHYLGDEVELRLSSSPDLRDLQIHLSASPPFSRLQVRLRDFFPEETIKVTVNGAPYPHRRERRPYPVVIIELTDVARATFTASVAR